MSIINSAMSGLLAAQAGLSNTSNNISSYTVQGYTRRTIQLAESHTTLRGNSYYGNGVNITGVQREYDDLITSQMRDALSSYSASSIQHLQISRLDDLFSKSSVSLSGSVQNFFSNLQNVTSNASDPAARQSLLSNAQGMVNQFQQMGKYLSGLQESLNADVTSNVKQINTLSSQVAQLNDQISKLSTASGGKPNDLLDQRDQLINKISSFIGIKVSQQDGKYNVSTMDGLSLVNGITTTQLVPMQSGSDPTRTTVGYKDKKAGDVQLSESQFKGGSLGGVLKFRNQDLDRFQNELGQLATVFVSRFNALHQQGFDSKGNPGGDFFIIGSPAVQGNSSNTSSATLKATLSDSGMLKASNYTVSYDGTNWTARRASDNAKLNLKPVTTGGETTLSLDGITLTVKGKPDAKDNFLIEPVRNVVSGMSVAITSGSQIAAAAAKGGESDNRNAQKLLVLQDARIINGSSTLSQGFASTVSEVGNKTKSLETSATTQKSVLTQLTNRQQAISGVNLDEEYANLTRYQQYYMANAQVLKAASSVFEALLGIR